MYNQLDTITIKYLLKVRVHLGRHQKQLEQKINSYLYGIKHNISIFNIEKIFWILRHFFQNLINFFNEQNSFFIVATESKLPIKQFLRAFEKNKIFQYSIYNTLHFDGFIQHKWLNGLFSNWKIIFNLLKKINTLEKSLKRKTYKNLIKHFEGLKYKKKKSCFSWFCTCIKFK